MLVRLFCRRQSLLLENLALRQQLVMLKRRHPRPSLGLLDKLFWVIARRVWSGWKRALLVVTPETVVRWHRAGFRMYWRLISRVRRQVTSLVGNMGFLLAQLSLISGWILVNLHAIPGLKTFDSFPFGVLALLVSSEGVFLTVFVLISQSRMARQSDRRSHLGLQVSMLSEQELTTILQMLQKLCQHMGVNVESSKQQVQSFTSELEDKLPEK
jgi:uncharacterized membrane protein